MRTLHAATARDLLTDTVRSVGRSVAVTMTFFLTETATTRVASRSATRIGALTMTTAVTECPMLT